MYKSFESIQKVTFYHSGNCSISEIASCSLGGAKIKAEIVDQAILENIFKNMRPIKMPIFKYDPGFGVVDLTDGTQIRFLTIYSSEKIMHVVSPENFEGFYQLTTEEARHLFVIQKREPLNE